MGVMSMGVMNDQPCVSVVTACYNPGRMFEGCLRSLFTQTYAHLQFIFVDNGCTDGSMNLLRTLAQQYRRDIVIIVCERRGQNAAFCAGYPLVRGDFFQWMDADDQLQPRKIESQVKALLAQPGADIAYGDWHWRMHSSNGEPMEVTFRSGQYDDYLSQQLLGNWRPPISFLLRRSAADRLYQMGAWDPLVNINTDRVYFTLAALVGLKFLHVPGAGAGVTYFTWNDQQITRKTPHTHRITHLQKFYAQMRDMVRDGRTQSLSPMHMECLQDDHARWKLRPLRVEQRGDEYFAVMQPTTADVDRAMLYNKTAIPISAVQALVLSCLPEEPEPMHNEHQARAVCQMLWRRASMQHLRSDGGVDFAATLRKLEKLVGLDADRAECLPEDAIEGDAKRVRWFLENGPLYVPMLAEVRLAIRRELVGLREMGLLRVVPV